MSADFTITTDRRRKLLDIAMSGFFSLDDVHRYHQAVHTATRELGGDPARQRMINDISGMRIQAQEIVAAFAEVMSDPRYAARQVAFIVESTLARMQIERAMGARNARLFRDRAEAEQWLFGTAERSAA